VRGSKLETTEAAAAAAIEFMLDNGSHIDCTKRRELKKLPIHMDTSDKQRESASVRTAAGDYERFNSFTSFHYPTTSSNHAFIFQTLKSFLSFVFIRLRFHAKTVRKVTKTQQKLQNETKICHTRGSSCKPAYAMAFLSLSLFCQHPSEGKNNFNNTRKSSFLISLQTFLISFSISLFKSYLLSLHRSINPFYAK
jgi:hypothetical protein